MAKPLAGKRAFEAMGRSAHSRGLSMNAYRGMRLNWPQWARRAWAAGWMMQYQRHDTKLPNGLWRTSEGVMYECRSCGQSTEWPAEIADFDINNYANVCGRSERCCP